ncbi:MAG TPA: trypsin-like serine protease [Solimonas sp.]
MRFSAACLALSLGLTSLAAPAALNLADVPLQLLPAGLRADTAEVLRSAPLSFATGVPLSLDEQDGVWDEPTPGTARWRLRLASGGALNLSAHLEQLQLPQGGEIWFSSADGRDVQGPFRGDGELLLPIVRDDEAVLEARMPAAGRDAFRLRVAEAFHGFRALGSAALPAKGAIGDADGDCHIDVACSEGNAWRREIRSTVVYTRLIRLLVGTSLVTCSGAMVNNTAQNDRPLVLTANHCGITSSTRMSDVTVYFNVQKASCGSSTDGPINQNLRGGRFLARDSESDFTLFELASSPPSSYGVHYSGWDARSGNAASSGVGIHHPGGDDKKISAFNTSLQAVENAQIDTFRVDGWQVRWARGVTEQGSSGSGLWNQDHRLVGTLSGGSSSCSNPGGGDIYARFNRAWTANNASTGQLKAHLDPTGSGALTLNGKDAGGSPGAVGEPPSSSSGGGSGGSAGGGGGGALGWPLLLPALLLVALRRRECGMR